MYILVYSFVTKLCTYVNRINYILTCDIVLYGKVLDINSTLTSCLFPRVKVISHLIYKGLGESCCWVVQQEYELMNEGFNMK